MLASIWCLIWVINSATAFQHYSVISTPETKNRSVNIALESVMQLKNKEKITDVKLLDNVQNLITKVKTVIDRHNVLRRNLNSGNFDNFTGFIKNVIEILNKLKDADLKYFFTVINDEIRNYHYRGCKFNELIDDLDLKKYLAIELDRIKIMPASMIRNKMLLFSKYIEGGRGDEKELFDSINSMYKMNAIVKFEKFLIKLDDYRQKAGKGADLVNIIRKGLRSIVFDHYTQLNKSNRVALRSTIEEYWNNVSNISNSDQDLNLSNNTAKNSLEASRLSSHKKGKNQSAHKAKLQNFYRTQKTTEDMKTESLDKETVEDENQDNDDKSYSDDNLITETTTEVSKSTSVTLYPNFISDRQTPTLRLGKKNVASTPEQVVSSFWKSRDKDIYTNVKPRKRVYDSDLEQYAPLRIEETTNRIEERTAFRQVHAKNYDDLKYFPNAIHYTTKDKNNVIKRQRLVSTPRRLRVTKERKNIAYSIIPHVYSTQTWQHNLGNPEIIYTPESREPTSSKKSTEHRAVLEFVTIKPYVLKRRMKTKKKYAVRAKRPKSHPNEPALYLKKPEFQFNMAGSLFPPRAPPIIRHFEQLSIVPSSIHSDRAELSEVFSSNGHKQVGSSEERAMVSKKPFSIKGHRLKPKVTFRTRFNKDIIEDKKHYMTRIQRLKKELNVARRQIKNDSEIIKELSSKVRVGDVHDASKEYKDTKISHFYKLERNTDKSKIKTRMETVMDRALIKFNNRKQNNPLKDFKNYTTNDDEENKKHVSHTNNLITNNDQNDKWDKLGRNRGTTVRKYYDNVRELREEQERKYYSNSSIYSVPKARIYDSDSDKDNYNKKDSFERSTSKPEEIIHNSVDDIARKDILKSEKDTSYINNKTNIGRSYGSNKDALRDPSLLNSRENIYLDNQNIYLRHDSKLNRQSNELNNLEKDKERLYGIDTSNRGIMNAMDINRKANEKLYDYDKEIIEQKIYQRKQHPDTVTDKKTVTDIGSYSNSSADNRNVHSHFEIISDRNFKKHIKENIPNKETFEKNMGNTYNSNKDEVIEYIPDRVALKSNMDSNKSFKEIGSSHDSYVGKSKLDTSMTNNTITDNKEMDHVFKSDDKKDTVPEEMKQKHNLYLNKDKNKVETTKEITNEFEKDRRIKENPDDDQNKGKSFERRIQQDPKRISLPNLELYNTHEKKYDKKKENTNQLSKNNTTYTEDAGAQIESTKKNDLDNKYKTVIKLRTGKKAEFDKSEDSIPVSIPTVNITSRIHTNINVTPSTNTNSPSKSNYTTSPAFVKHDILTVDDDKQPAKLNEDDDFQTIMNKTLALHAQRRSVMDEPGLLGHLDLFDTKI